MQQPSATGAVVEYLKSCSSDINYLSFYLTEKIKKNTKMT